MKTTYKRGHTTFTAEVWRVRSPEAVLGTFLLGEPNRLVVRTAGEKLTAMTGCTMRQVRNYCWSRGWVAEPVD